MNSVFGIPASGLLTALLILTGLIVIGVGLSGWLYPVAFRLGVRNLPRRKSQTILIIGGLALSTMIITSALGIGDTIDYSSKIGVYQSLGAIDIQLGSASSTSTGGGFSLGGGPPQQAQDEVSFDAAIATDIAALVDNEWIDGVVPALLQTLPVANSMNNLSEATVEIRGIGQATGEGLAIPSGLEQLATGEILINNALAQSLDASIGDSLLAIKGKPVALTVSGIIPDGELGGAQPAVLLTLNNAQTLLEQPGKLNTIFVSNAGDEESGIESNEQAITQLVPVVGELAINPVKADGLQAAEESAEFITTLFVTFGTFSVFSGILLIFLIFTVLAAERQSELGISRAVGQQRADLVRQFVTEGLAYNLLAAAAGAALGVLAAILLAGSIQSLLATTADLDITPRVSLRSIGIGYTLGVVITFLTVTISAIRISRINIIAAIRDLNLPAPPRQSQWTLFLHPFRVWRQALQETGRRNYRAAFKLFILAGPQAVADFWLGLLARGPVLLLLGFALAWVGVNLAKQGGVYGMGVSLFLIGIGQLASWLKVNKRAAFSFSGVALVLYWSLPTQSSGRLAELDSNPGDFFISGMFLVAGAIILFLYNAELLLNLFAGLLSRLGGLLPVARVSIAYPVAAKGRTATTLAMFSLIVFTLVGTATISNTFSNFLDVESGSGGYDILAQTNPYNPLPEQAFADELDQLAEKGEITRPVAVAPIGFYPVQAQSADMSRPAGYAINGAGTAFFESNNLEFSGLARGYTSDDEIWAALQADPSLIVIDNYSVDRAGDPTFQADQESFLITSISAGETVFDPVPVTIVGRNGAPQNFTVIGVLGSAPNFFGALMSDRAAQTLGYSAPNRYFVRLPEGADARTAANTIEGTFSSYGVQTLLPKVQLQESRESINSIFYLLQGFVGLGLLIGIAALGVVTIRSVVERRQQIGVLRAIGFYQGMIQGIFLFENLFVAGLGTLIGYVLALTFSYNLYLQVAADQGLAFLPPWPALIAIGLAILVAALAVAWLHARQSAKVVIAESLRYQA